MSEDVNIIFRKPIMHFIYPVLAELLTAPESDAVLSSKETLKSYDKKYLITRHHKFERDILVCASLHALYSDLWKLPMDHIYYEKYGKKCHKFGQQAMNLVVVEVGEEERIKRNCINAINFAMDKIYHVNEIIIRFDVYKSGVINGSPYKETSEFTNILYSVLQENFNIVSSTSNDKTKIITIKKRSE